jgi:hypothetical protein
MRRRFAKGICKAVLRKCQLRCFAIDRHRNESQAAAERFAREPASGLSEPAASILNAATRSFIARACCSSVFAAAAFYSTSAEFCWVASSIWVMARLT